MCARHTSLQPLLLLLPLKLPLLSKGLQASPAQPMYCPGLLASAVMVWSVLQLIVAPRGLCVLHLDHTVSRRLVPLACLQLVPCLVPCLVAAWRPTAA